MPLPEVITSCVHLAATHEEVRVGRGRERGDVCSGKTTCIPAKPLSRSKAIKYQMLSIYCFVHRNTVVLGVL